MLGRIWSKQGHQCPTVVNVFSDISDNHYAMDDIACLRSLGIINGTNPTVFSPNKEITRAQTAALLGRMWNARPGLPAETVPPVGGGAPPPGSGGGGPPPGDGEQGPTGASAPSRPATPTLTVADQSLLVEWTAPSDNGAPITDYDVQYRIEDIDLNRAGNQPGPWMVHTHTGTGPYRHNRLVDQRHRLPDSGTRYQQRGGRPLVSPSGRDAHGGTGTNPTITSAVFCTGSSP